MTPEAPYPPAASACELCGAERPDDPRIGKELGVGWWCHDCAVRRLSQWEHRHRDDLPQLEPEPEPDVDPETGEVTTDWRNLSPEFWESSDVLAHIRAAAHHRGRSADAVLLFTLARVATLVPHTVTLPAIVGGRGSLNFLGGVVSQSGGGKTTAGDVARDLVPIERTDIVADVPPGSGEGLTEVFFKWVNEEGPDGKTHKVKRKVKDGLFMYLDEGQALAEMGNRKGATLLPTLRSAWSGTVIGQTNASQETHRVLKAHTYRMAIVVGFQLEYAAELIADVAGGTPQRFVFATATDPTVPDEAPEWPGELELPSIPKVGTGTEMAFDPDIAAEIRRRSLMVTRGEYTPDPLDTHRDLTRMKVAALLAILHHRLYASVTDWELAGQVMRTSTAVRTWVIEYARQQAERSEQAYARRLADRAAVAEDSAERRALETGARAMGRKMHRCNGDVVSKRVLMAAVSGKHKKLVGMDDMLAHAEERGWITPVEDGWVAGESRPT